MNFTDEEIKNCSATKGDLLVCEGGAGYGRSAIWDKDYDICLQNHVHRLRPLIDGICEYVYFFIYLLKESNQLASVGTAMPGLSANRLKGLLLPLPPYEEQGRIVFKLKEIVPYLERYSETEEELSQLNTDIRVNIKKSILQEAIQGRLTMQNPDDESAAFLLQRIKEEKIRLVKEGKLKKKDVIDSTIFRGDDNKYFEKRDKKIVCIDDEIPFEIPNNWEWVRFGTLINMRMGKTPARGDVNYWTNGKTPWVSISDMFDYGIIKNTKEKVSDFAIETAFGGNIVPKGTLIMSFKLTVGRTSILDIDAVHNEAIISITPYVDIEDSLRDYLFYILPLISNFGDSKDAIKGKTLNSTSLYNLLIPLPPLKEQRRIVNAIITAWQVL